MAGVAPGSLQPKLHLGSRTGGAATPSSGVALAAHGRLPPAGIWPGSSGKLGARLFLPPASHSQVTASAAALPLVSQGYGTLSPWPCQRQMWSEPIRFPVAWLCVRFPWAGATPVQALFLGPPLIGTWAHCGLLQELEMTKQASTPEQAQNRLSGAFVLIKSV